MSKLLESWTKMFCVNSSLGWNIIKFKLYKIWKFTALRDWMIIYIRKIIHFIIISNEGKLNKKKVVFIDLKVYSKPRSMYLL